MRQLNNKLLAEVNERLGKISGVLREVQVLREQDEQLVDVLESVYNLLCDEVEVDDHGEPKSERDRNMLALGRRVVRAIESLKRGL